MFVECNNCGKIFKRKSSHIKKRKQNFCSKKCVIWKNRPDITPQKLHELYVSQNKTVRQICKILNAGNHTILKRLKKFNIPPRHGSEAIKIQWLNNENRKRELGLKFHSLSARIKKAVTRQEKRKNNPNAASKGELIMRAHLLTHGKEFIEEYAFHNFNIDFAFPQDKTAIEVNGGNWHNSSRKRKFDEEKWEKLKEEGWQIYINKCAFCNKSIP